MSKDYAAGMETRTCPHDVPMTQTCRQCGRWVKQATPPWIRQPDAAVSVPEIPLAIPCPKCGAYGLHTCPEAVKDRSYGLILDYLDVITEALVDAAPSRSQALMLKLTRLRTERSEGGAQ